MGPSSGYRWDCLCFFNDPATTEIYTLSLHDALPISKLLIQVATPWASPWQPRSCPNGSVCAVPQRRVMTDIEVHIDFAPGPKRVGTIHRHARRGGEAISFEYHVAWLEDAARFSLEPALSLDRGAFVPADGVPIFGSIGDSAPDTWGRRLMQRAERRRAEREGRAVRSQER